MNNGQIVTNALMRAELSVSDYGFREMALNFLDEIVQEKWSSKKFQFRCKPDTITTANGTEEYALGKLSGGVQMIVPNSMRGTDPYRRLKYQPIHDFFKFHTSELESGDPYRFREGRYRGFATQVSSASVITFVSSEANLTSGTVSVTKGLSRMTLSSVTLTLEDIGKWVRVGSDFKCYKIVALEPSASGTSSVFYTSEVYDGATNATATYAIGDINQKAIVTGKLSNGSIVDEPVLLNGTTSVVTVNSFSEIIRISKSDRTHGYVTATSNSGAVTNIILDPGETEADYQTVLLYPIPNGTETINYYSYTKHPRVWKQNESTLFPSQYHPLLALELYIRLMTEFRNQEVSQEVLKRRDDLLEIMKTDDNDSDNWEIRQETDEVSERHSNNNLPNSYGFDDSF